MSNINQGFDHLLNSSKEVKDTTNVDVLDNSNVIDASNQLEEDGNSTDSNGFDHLLKSSPNNNNEPLNEELNEELKDDISRWAKTTSVLNGFTNTALQLVIDGGRFFLELGKDFRPLPTAQGITNFLGQAISAQASHVTNEAIHYGHIKETEDIKYKSNEEILLEAKKVGDIVSENTGKNETLISMNDFMEHKYSPWVESLQKNDKGEKNWYGRAIEDLDVRKELRAEDTQKSFDKNLPTNYEFKYKEGETIAEASGRLLGEADTNYLLRTASTTAGSIAGFMATGVGVGAVTKTAARTGTRAVGLRARNLAKAEKVENLLSANSTGLILTNIEASSVGDDVAQQVENILLQDMLGDDFMEKLQVEGDFAEKEYLKEHPEDFKAARKARKLAEDALKEESLSDEQKKTLQEGIISGRNTAISNNMVNFLFNMSIAGKLTGGKKPALSGIYSNIQNKAYKEVLKKLGKGGFELAKEGVQEYIEEGVVNTLAEHSGIAVGTKGYFDYSLSNMYRIVKEEGTEAGLIGIISGVGMGAVAPLAGKGVNAASNKITQKRRDKAIRLLTTQLLDRDDTTLGQLIASNSSKSQSLLKYVINRDKLDGLEEEQAILDSKYEVDFIFNAIADGSVKQLKDSLTILSESHKDENTKQRASEILSSLDSYVELFNEAKEGNIKNAKEIISLTEQNKLREKGLISIQNKRDQSKNKILDIAKRLVANEPEKYSKLLDENGELIHLALDNKDLSDNIEIKKQQLKLFRRIKRATGELVGVYKLDKVRVDHHKKESTKTESLISELRSDRGQEAATKMEEIGRQVVEIKRIKDKEKREKRLNDYFDALKKEKSKVLTDEEIDTTRNHALGISEEVAKEEQKKLENKGAEKAAKAVEEAERKRAVELKKAATAAESNIEKARSDLGLPPTRKTEDNNAGQSAGNEGQRDQTVPSSTEEDNTLEAKRADIERRRQEEINNKAKTRKGNTISVYEISKRQNDAVFKNEEWKKLNDYMTKLPKGVVMEGTPMYNELVALGVKPSSNGINSTDVVKKLEEIEKRVKSEEKKAIKTEGLKVISNGARKLADKDFFDKINAKYDAELASLDEESNASAEREEDVPPLENPFAKPLPALSIKPDDKVDTHPDEIHEEVTDKLLVKYNPFTLASSDRRRDLSYLETQLRFSQSSSGYTEEEKSEIRAAHKAFYDWMDDPSTSKEGFQFELELDLKALNKFVAFIGTPQEKFQQAATNNKIDTYLSYNIKIKVNDTTYTYLKNEEALRNIFNKSNDNLSEDFIEAQIQKYRNLSKKLEESTYEGKKVYLTLDSQSSGFFPVSKQADKSLSTIIDSESVIEGTNDIDPRTSKPYKSNTPKENFESGKTVIGIVSNKGNKVFNGNSKDLDADLDSTGKLQNSGPGSIVTFIKGANGKAKAFSHNYMNIGDNQDVLELIAKAQLERASNPTLADKPTTITNENGEVLSEGLSPNAIIKLFVSINQPSEIIQQINSLSGEDLTLEKLKPLLSVLKRSINGKILGTNLFDSKELSLGVNSFTLLGTNYSSSDINSYDAFILNTHAIKTKLKSTKPKGSIANLSNTLIIENNTETNTATPIEESSEQSSEFDEDFDDFMDDDNEMFRAIEEDTRTTLVSNSQERAWLNKSLPQIAANSKEVEVIHGVASDKTALGVFITGLELLNTTGSAFELQYTRVQPENPKDRGTIYHEAFHAVELMLLSPEQRAELYKAARTIFGENANIKEDLAEAFRRFMISGETLNNPKINNYFKRILLYIREFFSKDSTSKINTLFKDINNGKFANTAVRTDNITKTIARDYSLITKGLMSVELNLVADFLIGVSLSNKNFSITETLDITEGNDKKSVIRKDVAIHTIKKYRAKYNDLKNTLLDSDNAADKIKIVKLEQRIERLSLVLSDLESEDSKVIEKVKARLKNHKTTAKKVDLDKTQEDDPNSATNEADGQDIIDNYEKIAYEFSPEGRASAFIRLMIAGLPIKQYTEDNSIVIVKDNILGLPKMAQVESTLTDILVLTADVIGQNTPGLNFDPNLNDTYARMSYKIRNSKTVKPHILDLLDKIETKRPGESDLDVENRKTKFTIIANQAKVNHLSQRSTVTSNGDTRVKTVKALEEATYNRILNNWNSQVVNTLEKTKTLTEVLKATEKLSSDLFALDSNTPNLKLKINTAVKDLNKILTDLGLSIHPKTIRTYIDRNENTLANLKMLFNSVEGSIAPNNERIVSIASIAKRGVLPDFDYKFTTTGFGQFKELALVEADLKEVKVQTTVYINNKTYYGVAPPSREQDILNGGRSRHYWKVMEQKLYTKRSRFITGRNLAGRDVIGTGMSTNKALAENIHTVEFTNFRNDKGYADKAADLSPTDEFVSIVNIMLSSHVEGNNTALFRMPSFGSKGRAHKFIASESLSLQEPEVIVENGKVKSLDRATISIFVDYLLDEIERITVEKDNYILQSDGTYKFDTTKGRNYENYHTNANSLKGFIFSNLGLVTDNTDLTTEENIIRGALFSPAMTELYKKDVKAWEDAIKNIEDDSKSSIIYNYVESKLVDRINNQIDSIKANEASIINKIDEKIKESYADRLIKDPSLGLVPLMSADIVINSLIGNVESIKLFNGDPAFSKDIPDLQKRLPSIMAAGTIGRISDKFKIDEKVDYKSIEYLPRMNRTYKLGIAKDVYKPSQIYTESYILKHMYPEVLKDAKKWIKEASTEAEEKSRQKIYDDRVAKGTYKKELLDDMKAYEAMNVTDAQGFMSIEEWGNFMATLGKLENEYLPIIDRLRKGTETLEDLRYIKESTSQNGAFSLHPSKAVQRTSVIDGDKVVPVYLKYTLAVLYPNLVKHNSKLNEIYEQLDSKDGPDSIVFQSAMKLGSYDPVDITEDGFMFADMLEVDRISRKMQVEANPKFASNRNRDEGTQHQINILETVRPEDKFDGERLGIRGEIEGEKIIDALIQLNTLRSKLSIDNLMGKIDTDEKLINILKESSIKENNPDNLMLDFLNEGYNVNGIVGALNKISSVLSSKVRSSGVRFKRHGGFFKQISSYSFNKNIASEESSIIWLDNDGKLEGAHIDKEGEFRPAKILLPYSALQMIPVEERTPERIKEIFSHPNARGLLQGIAIRIPNQPFSATSAIEIGGFLPEHLGDSAVVYDEGTTNNGSDFDDDKLQILLPTPRRGTTKDRKDLDGNIIKGKVYLYKKKTDLNKFIKGFKDFEDLVNLNRDSEDDVRLQSTLDNINDVILDIYITLLANPNIHSKSIRPLNSSSLKDKIKDKNKLATFKSGLDFLTLESQLLTKFNNYQAKELVGIGANNITNHINDHGAELRLPIDLGIGNRVIIDGKAYSDLSKTWSTDGKIISLNINSILDAALDAEKDDYLIQGGFNSHTINAAMVLLRAGVSEDFITSYMSSPVLKRMSILKFDREGSQQLKSSIKDLASTLLDESELIRYKKLVKNANLAATLYRIKSVINDGGTPNNADILYAFSKLDQLGDDITQGVMASSVLAKGPGKSLEGAFNIREQTRLSLGLDRDQMDLFDSLLETSLREGNNEISTVSDILGVRPDVLTDEVKTMLSNSKIPNFYKKYINDNGVTKLGALYFNNIVKPSRELENKVFVISPMVKDAYFKAMELIGNDTNKKANSKIYKEVSKALYSYLLTESPLYDTKVKEYFYGKNSIAKRYETLKKEEQFSDRDFAEFKNLLHSRINVKEGEPDFIFVENADRNNEAYGKFTEQWSLLLRGEAGPELEQFAKDLAYASFHSSGANYGSKTMYSLIPIDFFNSIGFNKHINESFLATMQGSIDKGDAFFEQFIRNNINNKSIVKEFPTNTTSVNDIITIHKGKKYLNKYHTIKNYNSSGELVSELYKATGKVDTNGGVIYKKIDELGYYKEGHKIVQYASGVHNLPSLKEVPTPIDPEPVTFEAEPDVPAIDVESPLIIEEAKEGEIQSIYKGKMLWFQSGAGKTTFTKGREDTIDLDYLMLEVFKSLKDILNTPKGKELNIQNVGLYFNENTRAKNPTIANVLSSMINAKLEEGKTIVTGSLLLIDHPLVFERFVYSTDLKTINERTNATERENPYTLKEKTFNKMFQKLNKAKFKHMGNNSIADIITVTPLDNNDNILTPDNNIDC